MVPRPLEPLLPILSTPLDECLSSRAKVRLLRFFTSTGEPVSGREAARRVAMAKRSIDLALRDLVAAGVVRRKDFGNQSLYQLNPQSVLGKRALITLFKGERGTIEEFFDTLRDLVEVGAEVAPLWAGLFGSTALGDDAVGSDVDLAVVVTTAALVGPMHARLSDSSPTFRRRFGRVLSPVVLSLEQLQQLGRAKSPLVAGLRTARWIAGSEVDFEPLLRDAR